MEKNNALRHAEEIKNGIKAKADKNKSWSTFFFAVIILATVISPTLILVSDYDIVSKYIPAGLSILAAIAAYWIQIRKPNERWVLYRTYQRELEYEISQYKFETGKYDTEEDKEKLLANSVNEKALKLHYDWVPIVPKATDVKSILPAPKQLHDGN